MKLRAATILATATLLATASQLAHAEEDDLEEGGKLYSVQNRKYVLAHEFSLSVGTVPLDAFYKGLTASFAYTYHFTDLWAWEIVNATYSLNLDTGLREDLQNNYAVSPTEFPELQFFFDSNVVLKPLYGKGVFLNDALIYGELYFTLGPAVARYENTEGVFIGPNAGVGLRIYLSQLFALRIEVRDYFYFSSSNPSDTKNELALNLGLGLNIR